MHKKEIIENLVSIGLNDKEAKVYLAALELGEATAQQIAAKAIVNRPSAYVAIESLIQQGMMSSFQKGKKRYFLAGKPRQLLYRIEQAKQVVSEKERAVTELVETLDTYTEVDKGTVQVSSFEGLQGIRMLQEDIYSSDAEDLYEVMDHDAGREIFPPPGASDDLRTKIREKFFGHRHTIYTSSKGPILKKNGNNLTHLSRKDFPISDEFLVYGDTTAFLSYEKNVKGFIIKSKGFADNMRIFLNMLKKKDK